MLLGIIKNETNNEHYFLHIDDNDFSIIHVNSTITEYLSRNKARDLLKTLLSSKLTYKEKEDNYDVYLDEANNRRYFKNGQENFFMFLRNNGEEAVYYLEKIDKNKRPMPKRYRLVVSDIVFSMVLTSVLLIPFSGDIRFFSTGKRLLSNAVTLTSDEMINLMNSSPYLNEEDTKQLCNEEYLKFVLSYSNTNDRNYYLREKLHNINIKYYSKDYMSVEGYYQTLDPNTIHIVNDLKNEKAKQFRSDVMTHEFIHLTQCDCKYTYIIESSTELLKKEFYNRPVTAYDDLIVRLKVLMEIIGPEPVLECIYKGDYTKLETEIDKYLSKKEATNLKKLFATGNIYEKNTSLGDLNYQIDILLATMYENKTGKNICQDQMISLIYNRQDIGRIYFNYNLEDYFKDYKLQDENELIEELDIEDVFNSYEVESYNYPEHTVEEKDGKKVNLYTTIDTKDFSSIPLDKINFINITFKDGTIGFARHDIDTDTWSKVEHYKIIENYESAIPKKFPKINNELNYMFNEKTIEISNKKSI